MSESVEIPARMRAVLVREYRLGAAEAIAALEVAPREVRRPVRGEVLVRMEAAPVNPSDLLFLQGLYGVRKKLPAVPGWEGAGRVVAGGGGLGARMLVGRRVACASSEAGDGTWAEYCTVPARQCAPLPRRIDDEQGATSLINPLTSIGMLERVRSGGHRAAVQNAAVSQVGLMFARLCRRHGIPLVHVVRRGAQAETLRSLGETRILDSSEPEFASRLAAAAREVGATIAFDAVAGEMTGTLLGALPAGSIVVVYGALAAEHCRGLDPIQLIFAGKRVEGFYLGDWLRRRGFARTWLAVRRSQRWITDGTLRTTIARRMSLDELRAGLLEHLKQTSAGKALLRLR